jgi:hypothetical protein
MDECKAFTYMLQAAELGYHRAQNNIGLYYKNGTGCEVSIAKAVEWLEKAEQGDYEKLAGNTLKNCRALLARRPDEAVSPEHEHAQGMTAFTNKDYKGAFDRWLSAAQKGSAEAMCDVGWMYSQGNGVAKNNMQAFKWMLESAGMDYVRAQNNIGLYYKNGTGCAVDLKLAVEWLEKAEAVCTHTYTHTHTHAHAHTITHAYARIHTHKHTHIPTYITHTHKHIHTRTHTGELPQVSQEDSARGS